MARRRVEEGAGTKPSAAERTGDLFQSAPLGTLTPEQREGEIKKVQDDAIARAQARRDLEKRAESDETGSITRKELDDEREAIQAEAAGALGGAFFGSPSPLAAPEKEVMVKDLPTFSATNEGVGPTPDEGDEVSCTKGEEMYGKPGQFSTYRVGPFSGTTKVRAGETRAQARRRLMDELNAFADEERERAKKAFLAHYPNAFS